MNDNKPNLTEIIVKDKRILLLDYWDSNLVDEKNKYNLLNEMENKIESLGGIVIGKKIIKFTETINIIKRALSVDIVFISENIHNIDDIIGDTYDIRKYNEYFNRVFENEIGYINYDFLKDSYTSNIYLSHKYILNLINNNPNKNTFMEFKLNNYDFYYNTFHKILFTFENKIKLSIGMETNPDYMNTLINNETNDLNKRKTKLYEYQNVINHLYQTK